MKPDGYNKFWIDCCRGAIDYVNSLRVGSGHQYRVSNIAEKPIAIASATAGLLLGFVGGLRFVSARSKQDWIAYLQSFQREDGLFEDLIDLHERKQEQPDWALLAHRSRHIAWAIESLGGRLTRPIAFVEPYTKPNAIRDWLDRLWQEKWPGGIWAASNWIMDMGVLLDLQYRHFDDDAAFRSLMELLDCLDEKQDEASGFWFGCGDDLRRGMAGAMHLYPLYWSYGREAKHFDRAVVHTLKLQQRDGLFGYEVGCGGSQCLDYDAVLILANGCAVFPHLRQEIRTCCKRVLKAITINQNPNGSFADSQSDRICHWATGAAVYRARDGSLWDTYARLMTIAMAIEIVWGQRPVLINTGRHLFEISCAGAGWEKGRAPGLKHITQIDLKDADYSVSVVIPAYNIEKYIAEAIDSVLAGTHRPNEIIVVDDGSTDGTAEVVRQYGSKVRYVHQGNAGVSAACNAGIKAATCQWIAFLDGDDKWLPEKLELQLELLQRNKDLMWTTCNFIYRSCLDNSEQDFLEFGKGQELLGDKEYFDSFITAITCGVGYNRGTMLINRRVFEQVGMFCEELTSGEDLDMALRISYHQAQIGYVNRPLAVYNWKRPDSLAVRPIQQRLDIVCEVYDNHLKLAAEHNRLDEFRTYVAWVIRRHVFSMYWNRQYDDLHNLIRRYEYLVPFRYKVVARLLTTLPMPRRGIMYKIARRLLGL
jgi:glycosyltransferase involved in cell wall biosynthesis